MDQFDPTMRCIICKAGIEEALKKDPPCLSSKPDRLDPDCLLVKKQAKENKAAKK